MPRHDVINGVAVPYTAEQESARDSEEAKILADKPMKAWQESMASSDNTLPRWAEDILDNIDTTNVPVQTMQKSADKKALRGTKP